MRLLTRFRRADLRRQNLIAAWRWSGRPEGVAEALASALGHPRLVVALSHSNYLRSVGGTELYISQEAAFLDARGISYVQLSPVDGSTLVEVNVDGTFVGRHELSSVRAAVARLRGAGRDCIAVHVHHLKGWHKKTAQDFITGLDAPLYRFFLHDYYSLCSNFNLLFGGITYCGGPPVESDSCTVCRWGVGRAAHLAEFADLFAALDRAGQFELIAPSEAAASIFRPRLPQYAAQLRVVPHQQLIDAGATHRQLGKRPSLGFVGYSDRCKGFAEWMELTSRPAIRDRYQLYHFGACGIPRSYVQTVDVNFQISGPDAMRAALEHHQLDFAFLWSIWPETFSFTCYEAMAAGAFVLTGERSGNIATQAGAGGRGRVFPDLDSVERFLVDDVAVAAARAQTLGLPGLRLRWNESLSEDLKQSQ
jgi:hypothetical protein